MLSSISPVGEAARRQRWSMTVSAYTLVSAAAGAAFGALLGAMGMVLGASVLGGWRVLLLGLAAALGAAIDARRLPVRLPSWRRQVDERWLTTYRGWVYGAGYGAQLGVAVVTIITSAVTYVALLAAVLTGVVWQGALIGATFGAVRALPLVATGLVRDPATLRRFHARLAAAARPAERATVAAQSGVAVLAVAALLAGVAA